MAQHRSITCLQCGGRHRSAWCDLPREGLDILTRARVCSTYRPGQVIYFQGNPCLGVYCIQSGTVAVRKVGPDGEALLVHLAHEGDVLGYRPFFAGEVHASAAEALTEARICFVDRATLRRLLDREPALGAEFLARLARDVRKSEEARLQASTLPVRARLAHLLLALKDRCGTALEDGSIEIRLPLSRRDIAAMLGARPETVARAIRGLQDRGVATFRGRTVLVPDLDPLLDEIETHHHT